MVLTKNSTIEQPLVQIANDKSRFNDYNVISVSKNPEDYANQKNLSPSPYTKYLANLTRSRSMYGSRPSSKTKIKRNVSIGSQKVKFFTQTHI